MASLTKCWFLLLSLLAVLGGRPCSSALRESHDRPNLVMLFADDLGYGDCGFTGHPTTATPNLDRLAFSGKILTTWYSACAVCSCSRAGLMTGRQYPRTGVKEVFYATERVGLPLEEITIAEQLKKANYSTAIVGKWHLGQRLAYLPGNQGFDYYLGIPYSDDMGNAIYTQCGGQDQQHQNNYDHNNGSPSLATDPLEEERPPPNDYAKWYLPLIHQEHNRTTIVEQPLNFSSLGEKYNHFATDFIAEHKDEPFFLYMPFSHVHTTSYRNENWERMPNGHYSDCSFHNTTKRGPFGDALAELDWLVGNVHKSLVEHGLEENTLILFTSDNGPWTIQGLQGGSPGVFTGEYAGYKWTGKRSTWEGGLREPAFAYWKGRIPPFSRSSETISSLDVFPTISNLAGVPLPADTIIDGRDMTDILLGRNNSKSKHDFLFFYGFCGRTHWPRTAITAVRHGPYKAHFCTGPGAGGSESMIVHYDKYPLLFNVDVDPSEGSPLCTGEDLPEDKDARAAILRIMRAFAMEKATFEYGDLVPVPDGPGEGPNHYGVCCDRATNCSCTPPPSRNAEISGSIFGMGSVEHHNKYHEIIGEHNHMASSV